MLKHLWTAGLIVAALAVPAHAGQRSTAEECKKAVLAQPGMKAQAGACGPACAAAVKRCVLNRGRLD